MMKTLKTNVALKITAFILTLVFGILTVGCAVCTVFLLDKNYFTQRTAQVMQSLYRSTAERIEWDIRDSIYYTENNGELTVNIYELSHEIGEVCDYKIYNQTDSLLLANIVSKDLDDYIFTNDVIHTVHWYSEEDEKQTEIAISIYLKDLNGSNWYARYFKARIWIYNNRFNLVICIAVFGILTIAAYSFLICAAGHRKGSNEICGGILERIPFDILTVAVGVLGLLCIYFVDDITSGLNYGEYIMGLFALLVLGAIFILWSMSFAVRLKIKNLIKTTLSYKVCKLSYKYIKSFLRFIISILRNLPLMWKTAVALCGISILEFVGLVRFQHAVESILILWFIEKALIIPLILHVELNLRKLQVGGKKLAEGDLSYNIDTSQMLWDFKKHGENLNSISLGMSKAVEESIKSERFRTELITNVSHDIKTPLTSIINYVDLLKKEEPEGEKVNEYLGVLDKQSDRLKKLVDDLVEASKASSGSLSVNCAPVNIDIVLTQLVGEYQDKMAEAGLELILKKPEANVTIMADGRHLGRVFDNLIGNVCKHALPQSRVYLTLEKSEDCAVISLKNISKYELDITSDELMERFVRGDKSRNTEGSGLGLSIAKSLTELQKGSFDIKIDGDLFKAIMKFKIV